MVLLPYEITLFSNEFTSICENAKVLLPYEITLFSNYEKSGFVTREVLLPYEITLFSNVAKSSPCPYIVLLPYEITLFSNHDRLLNTVCLFYYLMKSHYSQTQDQNTINGNSFTTL